MKRKRKVSNFKNFFLSFFVCAVLKRECHGTQKNSSNHQIDKLIIKKRKNKTKNSKDF